MLEVRDRGDDVGAEEPAAARARLEAVGVVNEG
jgi:hypothetical protein